MQLTAPDNAVPISDTQSIATSAVRLNIPCYRCIDCGADGRGDQLLYTPDSNLLYCPACRGSNVRWW